MKLIQYASGQGLLTRVIHVLAALMMVEKTVYGMPMGEPGLEDRAFLQHEGKVAAVIPERTHHNFQHLARIVKRSSAMSNAKNTYSQFYDKFEPFSGEIPSKLKAGAPSELSNNIASVTQIIKPSDNAFDVHDVESIIKNVMLVLSVTEKYLQVVGDCQYIDDAHKDWFQTQKQSLSFMIMINKMSMTNLRLEATDVEVVDTGIGGINTGVYGGVPLHVLVKIKELLMTLAAHTCQQ